MINSTGKARTRVWIQPTDASGTQSAGGEPPPCHCDRGLLPFTSPYLSPLLYRSQGFVFFFNKQIKRYPFFKALV